MPPRRLSSQEKAEWLSFAQSIGARPLHVLTPIPTASLKEAASPGPTGAEPGLKPADALSLPARQQAKPSLPRVPELLVGSAAAGLDAASWDKLRRGRMRPERVLDLHGRTAQAAFLAFERFIGTARADGVRCVEIVTGRGAGEGGVLRRELPHWINLPQIRGAILAATHPHRANVGAVVLLLRRIR